MAIGVFGLKQFYRKQYGNIIERNLSHWPEGATTGWFAGGIDGASGGTTTRIVRLNHSNDTASLPGKNLVNAKHRHHSLQSALYGYFCSGVFTPPFFFRGENDRIDFSNETISTPGKTMEGRENGASMSSRHYGFMVGGNVPRPAPQGGPFPTNAATRLDFFNETMENTGRNMTYAAYGMFGLTDNFNYGYVFGGAINSNVSRIDYASELYTLRSAKLPTNLVSATTVSSAGYGYIASGNTNNGPDDVSTITRIEFSTETISNPGNNLPGSTQHVEAGSSQTTSYGYFVAGDDPAVASKSYVTRLDFSNETISSPGKNIPANGYALRGVSGGASVLPS
jgi:hypothetical protein